jgi:uncharacterized protein (DUF2249 family)
MAASEAAPAGLIETPKERLVDLDVREDLRAGREPLRQILQAVKALGPESVLRVRAIFEPAPLYAVLGKQGLAHYTERFAADDWRVWFFRGASAGVPPARAATASSPRSAPPDRDDGEVVILDVRDLEPPEPMVRTLEALATLPRGKTLVQLNVRVPQFLLPKLRARGFEFEIREQSADLVRVFIRHTSPEKEKPSMNIELDIRVVPPREKHPTIFRTFDALAPGEAFTLINDHDPFPLRYQFEATRPGKFAWTYVESGPSVWRVLIEKSS